MESMESRLDTLTQLVKQLTNLQLTPTHSTSSNFNFREYESSLETIEDYFDRFKIQLDILKVPSEKYATLAPELNTTLRTAAFPTDVNTLTLDKIIQILTGHYIKSKNKYSEAIKFRKIAQSSDESVTYFVSRLKAGAR